MHLNTSDYDKDGHTNGMEIIALHKPAIGIGF